MESNQRDEQPAQTPASPHEPASESLVSAGTADEKNHKIHLSVWNLALKYFVLELLAVCLSIALLITIVVVLASYNHHPQPHWGYMSLNSLISWLSTISKACVLFAISESLGQLKWLWFTQKSQPMSDLQSFDAASRGLFGSAMLIWNLRARHFAFPGSLAVILALAFDPFAQNLIHYYPKLTPDPSQTAIVSNNTIYNTLGPQYGLGGETYVDPSLKVNVYSSIFNSDLSKPWSVPNYTCSTGNCTWDPISSLGMRAICSNITKYLDLQCHTTAARLSEAGERNCTIYIRYNSSTSQISSNFLENSPVGIAVVAGQGNLSIIQEKAPLSHIHLISPNGSIEANIMLTNSTQWQAMECTLKPIVRRARAAVTGGVYHEDTLSVWTDGHFDNETPGYVLRPTWGPEMGIAHNTTFSISSMTLNAMDLFMISFFAGKVQLSLDSRTFVPSQKIAYASADFMQAISGSNITGCTATGAEKLRCAMENAAAAIEKSFRDSTPYSVSGTEANSFTVGVAMSNMTYVAVHWQWITLPFLVWLLGVITIVGTMLKSRRAVVPRWKNNVMPLLFIYERSQDEQPPADGKLENNQKVRLYGSEGRIVLG